jgi:hypothetical protein
MALTSCRRSGCRAVLVAAALAAPTSGAAQVETYTRMSISAAQIYDGNLFATPAARGPQADVISRFGPAFEAGYFSLPLEIGARYEVQAERYATHTDLNENVAHQDLTLSLGYLPTPRIGLKADASYIATQTPGEFNLDSQLGVGRAPAERVATASTLTYNWSDVTEVSFEHLFGKDTLAGGVTSAMHRARLGAQRKTGIRNTYRADYYVLHIAFDAGAPLVSHVMTAGWSHSITPRTGFELTVGPRLSEGTIRPEVSAVLRRQLSRGEISFGYSRTEMTAFGERGTIDVHRVAATGRYRPWRRLSLTATPAFAQSTRDDRHVPVYTVDTELVVEATNRLSVVAWGRVGRQEGTLTGPPGMIPYHALGMKVMMTLPRRVPGAAARASS